MTPDGYWNTRGTNRVQRQEKAPGDRYDVHSYRRCIARACASAGVPEWSPIQLRHLRATEVRAAFGLEAAQAVLGDADLRVTQVYAERDSATARRVAAEQG